MKDLQTQIDKHDINGVLEFLALTSPRVQTPALNNCHKLLRELSFFPPSYLRQLACNTALIGLRALRGASRDENEDMFLAFLAHGYELLEKQQI